MVVPAGRMLSNGTIILPPETLIKGVSWKTKDFRVYDDGLIEQDGDKYRGLVAFGTVDSHNIFHLLPPSFNWKSLRANKTREAKNGEAPIIETDGKPIFVPTETLDQLFQNAVEEHSLTLIQVAKPSIGPPIILPIGALLEDGNILLNDGMEIRGVYFESEDRILYDNGTIIYKITGTTEIAQIDYASVDENGNVHLLPPDLLGQKPNMELFRSLNVKPTSRSVQTTLDVQIDAKSILHRRKRTITEFRQALNLVHLFELDLEHVTCELLKKLDTEDVAKLIVDFKPESLCFYRKIIDFCHNKN